MPLYVAKDPANAIVERFFSNHMLWFIPIILRIILQAFRSSFFFVVGVFTEYIERDCPPTCKEVVCDLTIEGHFLIHLTVHVIEIH